MAIQIKGDPPFTTKNFNPLVLLHNTRLPIDHYRIGNAPSFSQINAPLITQLTRDVHFSHTIHSVH